VTEPWEGSLPRLYQHWIAELVDGSMPSESKATCGQCAMLDPGGAVGAGQFFHPSTKCCTYHPALHNFLVGQILANHDDSPAARHGRAVVAERIASGAAVSPLGLAMPPSYRLVYEETPEQFGKRPAMRCPYYVDEEGGKCGVWRNRAAVCATWHCKLVRGQVGLQLWQSLRELLSVLEQALARHCVLELDPGEAAVRALFPTRDEERARPRIPPAELDGSDAEKARAIRWGRFLGRERDFYAGSAAIAERLTPAEVLALGGAEAAVWIRRLRDAHRAHGSHALPERIEAAPVTFLQIRSGRTLVSSYSPYDPVAVPERLLALLPRFDGRHTDEVLAELDGEGIRLDPMLVRRLLDFRLLRSA
jgi:hypothetical protein